MKSKNEKKWTEIDELNLEHWYLSLHLSIKELAERFNCTMGEIRRKVKEMWIMQ